MTCLLAAQETKGDVKEEGPASDVVAVANRCVVNGQNFCAINDRRFLVNEVADTTTEGPAIAEVVQRALGNAVNGEKNGSIYDGQRPVQDLAQVLTLVAHNLI